MALEVEQCVWKAHEHVYPPLHCSFSSLFTKITVVGEGLPRGQKVVQDVSSQCLNFPCNPCLSPFCEKIVHQVQYHHLFFGWWYYTSILSGLRVRSKGGLRYTCSGWEATLMQAASPLLRAERALYKTSGWIPQAGPWGGRHRHPTVLEREGEEKPSLSPTAAQHRARGVQTLQFLIRLRQVRIRTSKNNLSLI